MAKIKGIELKSIKHFRGHEEEELIQGNVYYKGKKVGYYSQDAWGGMDIFNLDYNLDKELRKEIENITNNYIGGVLFEKIDKLYNQMYKYEDNFKYEKKGYEYLFMDLLELKDHEDLYKKYKKKFNNDTIYIVYEDVFTRRIYNIKNNTNVDKIFGNKTYFKYESLNDFIVE